MTTLTKINKDEIYEKIRHYIRDNETSFLMDYLFNDTRITWWCGFYLNSEGNIEHSIGDSVGNEILESERPLVCIKVANFDDFDRDFWTSHAEKIEDEEGNLSWRDPRTDIVFTSLEDIANDCVENGCMDMVINGLMEEIDDYLQFHLED